jgi:hypothetical protein
LRMTPRRDPQSPYGPQTSAPASRSCALSLRSH